MFTPFFWCFKYFARLGEHDAALSYVLRTLKQMEKHCPSPKQGYLVKAMDCAKYLKKNHRKKWREIFFYYKKNSQNDCIHKMIKKMSI